MLGRRERLAVKEQGLDLKCEGRQGPQQEREGVGFPGRRTGGSQGRPAPSIGPVASSIILRRNSILKAAGSHVRVGNGEQ